MRAGRCLCANGVVAHSSLASRASCTEVCCTWSRPLRALVYSNEGIIGDVVFSSIATCKQEGMDTIRACHCSGRPVAYPHPPLCAVCRAAYAEKHSTTHSLAPARASRIDSCRSLELQLSSDGSGARRVGAWVRATLRAEVVAVRRERCRSAVVSRQARRQHGDGAPDVGGCEVGYSFGGGSAQLAQHHHAAFALAHRLAPREHDGQRPATTRSTSRGVHVEGHEDGLRTPAAIRGKVGSCRCATRYGGNTSSIVLFELC